MGGPNHNAIPIYGDNKAPNGIQVKGANGLQLMLENSNVSGVQYIIVNPALITEAENVHNQFVTFKQDGQPNYIRLWIRNSETGKGDDYAPGVSMWAEYSHLQVAEAPTPPTPPIGDESTFVIGGTKYAVNWAVRTITVKSE